MSKIVTKSRKKIVKIKRDILVVAIGDKAGVKVQGRWKLKGSLIIVATAN